MRLVFVRQNYSAFGGGERILDDIIRELGKRGEDVTLVTRSWPEDRPGVRFVRCDPPKISRAFRNAIFARAACRVLADVAPPGSGTIVQSHERLTCCDIFRAGDGVHAAYLASRGRTGGIGLALSPFHRAVLRLEKRLFESPRLKAVIAISRMVADDIARHYPFPRERIHHIPNGVDLHRFTLEKRSALRPAARERLGISGDRPVLLFVGSGFGRKGLGEAIDALAASGTEADLIVVGRDRRPKVFVDQAEKLGLRGRIRMIGPAADSLPYYAAADAVILPSVYEPFGSVVLEGLASGLPVIVSTRTGGAEAAGQLDPALVQDRLDRDGLGAAIRRAFDLAGGPATATRARAIAESHGMDRMLDGLMTLYRGLEAESGS